MRECCCQQQEFIYLRMYGMQNQPRYPSRPCPRNCLVRSEQLDFTLTLKFVRFLTIILIAWWVVGP